MAKRQRLPEKEKKSPFQVVGDYVDTTLEAIMEHSSVGGVSQRCGASIAMAEHFSGHQKEWKAAMLALVASELDSLTIEKGDSLDDAWQSLIDSVENSGQAYSEWNEGDNDSESEGESE